MFFVYIFTICEAVGQGFEAYFELRHVISLFLECNNLVTDYFVKQSDMNTVEGTF